MKKFLFAILVLAQINFCFAEKIALCLSGGGAKGAYEIGVWKAMEEYGLTKNIVSISGTSVGGLNAVLLTCMSTEGAKSIWQNEIFFTTILTPDSRKNELNRAELKKIGDATREKYGDEAGKLDYLKEIGAYAIDKAKLFLGAEKFHGIFERSGLEELIETSVPLEKIYDASAPEIFISTVEKQNGGKLHVFKLQDQGQKWITPILLATSAIPFAFDSVTLYDVTNINGRRINYETEFFDGGTDFLNGDNTNISPLLDSNCETIFTVFLQDRSRMEKSSAHKDAEKCLKEKYDSSVAQTKLACDAEIEKIESLRKQAYAPYDKRFEEIKAEKKNLPMFFGKSEDDKERKKKLDAEEKSLNDEKKKLKAKFDDNVKETRAFFKNKIDAIPKPEVTAEWEITQNRYLSDPNFERQTIIEMKDSASKSRKKIVFFVPSEDLGNLISGTLNFDGKKLDELIDLGYKDALKVLQESGYSKSWIW